MHIHREITPLRKQDVFVVLDSTNNGFDYPIHNHAEYELNLITGMSGTRIVGDSTERYTDQDLVLLGPYLYHKWDGDQFLQDSQRSYRVITIQFNRDIVKDPMFQKDKFVKIRMMLLQASRGLSFTEDTIRMAREMMTRLIVDRGFSSIIDFLNLLDLLSKSKGTRYLASEGFRSTTLGKKRTRIHIAYDYILKHFTNPELKVATVAKQLSMGESAFSHFFKKHAYHSFTEFLIDLRIGYACKLLLDTDYTVSEISGHSGFNNIANFNRLFKKYRLCTPTAYRKKYLEGTNFDLDQQVTPWQFIPDNAEVNEIVYPKTYSTRVLHH